MGLNVGDRVRHPEKGLATVRYFGPHRGGKEGNRVGLQLDKPNDSCHNGTISGLKYFKCPEKCGMLVTPKKVEMVMSADDHEMFMDLITPYSEDDRVDAGQLGHGTVKFCGPHHAETTKKGKDTIKPSKKEKETYANAGIPDDALWVVGVELDDPKGDMNGTVDGHVYWMNTTKKFGCLVPVSQVKLAKGEKDRMKSEMKDAKAELKGKSRRESVELMDVDGDGKVSDAERKAYARKQAKEKKKKAQEQDLELDLDSLINGSGAAVFGLGHVATQEGADYTSAQAGVGSATLLRREAAISLAEQKREAEAQFKSTIVTPAMRKVKQQERETARLQAAKDKKRMAQEKKAAEAAERAAKAAMRKEREKDMRERKAAEMEVFRKAEAAKRAEKEAAEYAAGEKKRQAAAAWAKQVAEVEAMDIGVWEKKTKLKELKEVNDLRKAEDEKQEAEDDKVRRQEQKEAFTSRYQGAKVDPNVQSRSDATIARSKEKRQASKWSAPKPMAAISEPGEKREDPSDGGSYTQQEFIACYGGLSEWQAAGGAAAHRAKKDYDPQQQYLVTSKHLATMRRAVGSKKAIFEARTEDVEEEHSSRQGEYDVACVYVETLVWSFNNRKSGDDFVEMMAEIVDDDRQAEAFFQVYELPIDVEGASVQKDLRQYDNDYLPGGGDIRYLTVAIGTTEQYCDLHRIYNMRQILQADVTPWNESADAMRAAKQLQHQRGIKHLTGTFNCIKKVASVGQVIDDWNKAENVNIRFEVNKDVSVAGGWSTVSRFVGGTGPELLMSFGLYQSADKAGSDDAFNWLEVARSEYHKVAPNIGNFIIFKGVKSPLDYEQRESETNFSSFSMHSSKLWTKAKAKSKVSIDDEMAGVERCKRWYFGPGTSNPDLVKYVAATRANPKIAAAILKPLF